MKLLLILLVSFAFGQDVKFTVDKNVYPELFQMDNKDYKCWDKNDIITVQDILEYAEECYNDSTIYYRYVGFPYIKKTSHLDSNLIKFHKTFIEHKEPTFEGFIEWLERSK